MPKTCPKCGQPCRVSAKGLISRYCDEHQKEYARNSWHKLSIIKYVKTLQSIGYSNEMILHLANDKDLTRAVLGDVNAAAAF